MNSGVTKTPVGLVSIYEVDGAITHLRSGGENSVTRSSVIKEGLRQLEAYFNAEITSFDLPLNPAGSPFQLAVYDEMLKIKKGHTATYGMIGDVLGAPAQAVGQACGTNPIPIIIPCHRVVGAQSLGGYSGEGGIETKVKLLQFEGAGSLLL